MLKKYNGASYAWNDYFYFLIEEVLLEECYSKYFHGKEWLPTKKAFPWIISIQG